MKNFKGTFLKLACFAFSFSLGATARAELNTDLVDSYAEARVDLKDGMNSAFSSNPSDVKFLRTYYERYARVALINDWESATAPLDQSIRGLEVLVANQSELEACIDFHDREAANPTNGGVAKNNRRFHEDTLSDSIAAINALKGTFRSYDRYVRSGLSSSSSSTGRSRSSRSRYSTSSSADSGYLLADRLRDETPAFVAAISKIKRECCDKGQCSPSTKAAVDQAHGLDVIVGANGPYSNPIFDHGDLGAEGLAAMYRSSDSLRNALNEFRRTGDSDVLVRGWEQARLECHRDRLALIDKEVQKIKNQVMLGDVAHMLQCTLPTITVNNESGGFHHFLKGAARVKFNTRYNRFGCPDQVINALEQARPIAKQDVVNFYQLDSLYHANIVENNANYALARDNILMSSSSQGVYTQFGFFAAFPPAEVFQQADAGSQQQGNGSSGLPVASNVTVESTTGNSGRSTASITSSSSRTAPSRGASSGSSGRLPIPSGRSIAKTAGRSEGRAAVKEVRRAVAQVRQGKNTAGVTRTLAGVSRGIRQDLSDVKNSMVTRGVASIRSSRKDVASNAKEKAQRMAASRIRRAGARTSANDIAAVVARLKNQKATNPNDDLTPTTPTTPVNNSDLEDTGDTTGNLSDWDKISAQQKAEKLRNTQKAFLAQANAKYEEYQTVIEQINEEALALQRMGLDLRKYRSDSQWHQFVDVSAPKVGRPRREQLGQQSVKDHEEFGIQSAKVTDLRFKKTLLEHDVANLMRLYGSAGGQVPNFGATFAGAAAANRASLLPNAPVYTAPETTSSSSGSSGSTGIRAESAFFIFDLLVPKAWASKMPMSPEQELDAWRNALVDFSEQLNRYAKTTKEEEYKATKEYVELYKDYYWTNRVPETVIDIPAETISGISFLQENLELELNLLLEELRDSEGGSNLSANGELMHQLEEAHTDSVLAGKLLEDIVKLQIQSAPEKPEDHPAVYFAPAGQWLLGK